ncbi:BLOC-1-related complex subunit 6 isoform X2 [Gouania willdenowi]|uniref:BLOC-1-related complex subunit 6 C-terminal helix domain-containing protein n=1 Tax=Gouania willdenowi TaxID=441366 RepID=A0A8C5EDK4_GOUWI|nr:BLOC-1-related complex subunit 6 isoform X2 [Gouania willdenowi]
MSLSPVIGTQVPETANGVAPPVAVENGPHVSVNFGQSRLPDPGDESVDLEHTGNHVENSVTAEEEPTDISERTSCFSLHTPHRTDPFPRVDDPESELDSKADCVQKELVCDSAHDGRSSLGGESVVVDRRTEEKEEEEDEEEDEEEKEKQDEEEDEKNESTWTSQAAGKRPEVESSSRHYSSSAPGSSTTSSSSPPPSLLPSDDIQCPPHIMAQVWVRNVRGMQDSKSLDEISQACGGGSGSRGGGRSGQSEGRRATISSALELEGTVSHEGDITNFITKNLEQKIKMSSKPSLDCSDSDCSGPIYRSRGLSRRPADIPPIDPSVLSDLQRHTQEVAHSVEMMMRSLNGTIQNMTALSVGYIQTYRDSVDSLGESVDMSIKGMYTLMARCEELDRSMQPIHTLAAQIRDIKRTLDALEAVCK